MKVAAIDIGSYTTKMAVGTRSGAGAILVLGDYSQDNDLVGELDERGRLSDAAIGRCVQLVDSYRRILKGMGGIETIRLAATAAIRRAPNSEDLAQRLRESSGLELEILPAREESAYVYVSSFDVHPEGVDPSLEELVVDVGGGSTEFALGERGRLIEVQSSPQGAARLASKFLYGESPPSREDCVAACKYLSGTMPLDGVRELIADRSPRIVGCGSTIVGVAGLEHGLTEPKRHLVHSRTLSADTLFAWYEKIFEADSEELDAVQLLAGPRGRVFLAGLSIWLHVLETLGIPEVTVSDNGLRHGLMRDTLGLDLPFT